METEARKKVCGECSQSAPRPDGGVRCRVCGCPDPLKTRPRCPLGKWGVTPLSGCAFYHEDKGAGSCEKQHTDCAGCPDKSNEDRPAYPPAKLPEGIPSKADEMAIACGIRANCLKGTPADCAHCPWLSALPAPKGVVVISSKDEGDDLRLTIAAILSSSKFVKGVIVVDDASETPENVEGLGEAVRLVRLEENAGVAGARHKGITLALEGDYDTGAIFDAHMKPGDRAVDMILRYAQVHRCFCYAGVIGHLAADLRNVNGLIECKWINRTDVEAKKQRHQQTTGMMGASYAFPMDVVSDMGGWIWFPGQWGRDEEAMSLLCLRHKIPIVADTEIQNFHKFWYDPADTTPQSQGQPRRKFSIPNSRFLVNVAALHRLFFEDAAWEHFKPKLAAYGISDALIHEVEGTEMIAYGKALRERFKTTETEFWMEFFPKGQP